MNVVSFAINVHSNNEYVCSYTVRYNTNISDIKDLFLEKMKVLKLKNDMKNTYKDMMCHLNENYPEVVADLVLNEFIMPGSDE